MKKILHLKVLAFVIASFLLSASSGFGQECQDCGERTSIGFQKI